MKKVVIACDSFKGSLTSAQANRAVAKAVAELYPQAIIEKVSVADGGEGTASAIAEAFSAKKVRMKSVDALGRPIDTTFYINLRSRTAVIDTASASGLPQIAPCERDIFAASSYGTGRQIAAAIDMGCREIYLGLGGSATCDCGTGLLQALGYRFLDSRGTPLGRGAAILPLIAGIDSTQRMAGIDDVRFTLFSDVDNVLFGAGGAAFTFAPQKGADRAACEALDAGARNFASALVLNGYDDTSNMAGAGTAGGIGAALAAILHADILQGAPAVLETLHFDDIIFGADIVITGEGRIDSTTLRGKTPFAVLQAARRQSIPTVAVAGTIDDGEALAASGFEAVEAVKPPEMPLAEAMRPATARRLVESATRRILDGIGRFGMPLTADC